MVLSASLLRRLLTRKSQLNTKGRVMSGTSREPGQIGGQLSLDPDSDASKAARGLLGDSLIANEQAWDDAITDMGLDPADPKPHDPADPVLPGNVEVPHVSQTGDTLHCTMGVWTGDPDTYAYQWKIDGTNTGTNAPDYVVKAADVGNTATCVVTASNEAGATVAPPSVGIVVSGSVTAATPPSPGVAPQPQPRPTLPPGTTATVSVSKTV
jgi:hypothetical protein